MQGTEDDVGTDPTTNGHFLSREEIIGAQDVAYDTVEVPEWGGTVRIRGLLAGERDAFEKAISRQRQTKGGVQVEMVWENARAKLVALSVVDAEGNPEFSEADVGLLAKKNAVPISRIYEAAASLSGLTPDDMEELVQGFEPAASEG